MSLKKKMRLGSVGITSTAKTSHSTLILEPVGTYHRLEMGNKGKFRGGGECRQRTVSGDALAVWEEGNSRPEGPPRLHTDHLGSLLKRQILRPYP